MGIYCLTAKEARSPRSRCRQGWFLLRAVRESLSCASPLASGGLPATFGVPQFLLYHSSLRLCVHTCMCLGPNFFPFYKDTSQIG